MIADSFKSANRYFFDKKYRHALDCFKTHLASSENTDDVEKDWYSLICVGRCLEKIESGHAQAASYFLKAFDLLPERAESIYYLGRHFIQSDRYQEAYDLVQLVAQDEPAEYTFGEVDVYRFKLKLLLIQCSRALGQYDECITLANDLMATSQLPEHVRLETSAIRARAYQELNPLTESENNTQNRFLIVVAFHNPGSYLHQCIESIDQQSYRHFRVILIDDASRDGALDDCKLNDQFRIIQHTSRRGALVSAHEAILRYSKPSDIVVHLDGDDAFEHELALENINQLYNRSGCWALYGQYRVDTGHIGHARPFYRDELDHPPLTHRAMAFPIHVRSYRAGLYHQIKIQDKDYSIFKDSAGKWLTAAVDIAQMRTIFQLAGHPNIRFNSEPLYRYNYQNPMGNHFVSSDKQKKLSAEIAKHQVLKPVRHYLPARSARPNAKLCAPPHKVMCIGIDGGNPDILDAMISRGKLPNLQALLEQQAPVKITKIESHTGDGVFWPSIYTGLTGIDHGRLFRVQPDLFDPQARPYNLTQNQFAPPFWNDLLVQQRKVVLVDLPYATSGADKNLTQVNNWLTHEPDGPFNCHPDTLLSRLDDLDAHEEIFVTAGKTAQINQYPSHFELFKKRIQRKQAVNIALAQQDWDFYMTVFGEAHDAGHHWWHQHDAGHRLHRPELNEQSGDIIEHTYACIDEEIPALLKHCNEQTHIFVICGLAMGRNISCNSLSGQIVEQLKKFWKTSDPHRALHESLASGQATIELLPYNNNALPIKIVSDKPHAKEALLSAIETSLLKIVNPDTGQAVVSNIERTGALDTHLDHPYWPDSFAIWQRDSFIDRIYSSEIGEINLPEVQGLDCRSGDHTPHATLYMNQAAQALHGNSTVTAQEVGHHLAKSAGLAY